MQKRVYDFSRQENKDFCVPSVFQAIMRKYGFELTQEQIAKEIDFDPHPKELADLSKSYDFFRTRNLNFQIYHYDQTPYHDHEVLVIDAFEKNQDLIVGVSIEPRRHVFLALDLTDWQLILRDPGNLDEISMRIYDLERKMYRDKFGIYGLISKI